MKPKRFRPLQILCPNCGQYFPHDCARELGRLGTGRSSAKKLAASRANAAKGREVIERNRQTQCAECEKYGKFNKAVTARQRADGYALPLCADCAIRWDSSKWFEAQLTEGKEE